MFLPEKELLKNIIVLTVFGSMINDIAKFVLQVFFVIRETGELYEKDFNCIRNDVV